MPVSPAGGWVVAGIPSRPGSVPWTADPERGILRVMTNHAPSSRPAAGAPPSRRIRPARDADHRRAHRCRVAEVRRPRAPGHPGRARHHGQGVPGGRCGGHPRAHPRRSGAADPGPGPSHRHGRGTAGEHRPDRAAVHRRRGHRRFRGQARGPRCGARRLLAHLRHGQLRRRGVQQPVAVHPRPLRADQGTRASCPSSSCSTSGRSRRCTGCSATLAPRTAVMSTATWSWGSPAACPATPPRWCRRFRRCPPGATWSATGIGRTSLPVIFAALSAGGHLRVGMEDTVSFARGRPVTGNAELVERAAALAGAGAAPAAAAGSGPRPAGGERPSLRTR